MKTSAFMASVASLVIVAFITPSAADARDRHRDRDDYRYSSHHDGGGKHYRKKHHRKKHHQRKHHSTYYGVGFSYGYPSYGYNYWSPGYSVNYNFGYGYYGRGHHHYRSNAGAYTALGVGIGYLLSEATRPREREREVIYAPTETRREEPRQEYRPEPTANYNPQAEFPNGCIQTREYTTTITIAGEEKDAYGTACLQADGSWLTGAPKVVPDY